MQGEVRMQMACLAIVDEPGISRQGWKAIVSVKDNSVLGANIDVSIGFVEIEATADWLWLQTVWVHKDYRRRGIARELVEIATIQGRAQYPYAVGVSAGIGPDNEASKALFRSLGFTHNFTFADSGAQVYSRRFAE